MALIIHRWFSLPAAAAFFAVVLTLPAPATPELMPPVTLFVFLLAIVAVGIVRSGGALARFRPSRRALAPIVLQAKKNLTE